MEASGSRGETAGPWTATSTWIPAGGAAVEDAVSFETSDVDAEESPAGVVLTRPDPDDDGDAPPCEVTVSFRGTYEIHRVYVRSTARTYEIYHSTNANGTDKDYLCTVRCGLAAKEPQPCGEESNASTSEKREHEMKSVSSSSSDDSWVDVKIPESPHNTSESQERNVDGTCQENNLAHYEATAEMTDVTPCVSLTVRLLSLQPKTSVHIEEIYIFADPVESTNDDSVTGHRNMGDGSSLLAMLVPGLMHLSKSRNYKIDDGYFSHGSKSQPTMDHAVKENSSYEKSAQETGPSVSYDSATIGKGIDCTDAGTESKEKSNQAQLPFKDPMCVQLPVQTTENSRLPSVKDQLVSNTDQLANPLMNGIFTPYNNIERKLDMLLSKVEKMELYCSRFEDSMIKPIGSIEARLQQLEQQFDSFSVEIKSLRCSSATMSAPDGPSDTNLQKKVRNDANTRTPASMSDSKPVFFVKAPDFCSEDFCSYDVTDGDRVNFHGPHVVPRLFVNAPEFISQPELTGEKLDEGPILPVDYAQSSEQKERKTSPGLVVKVPEFLDDGDDDDDDDDVEEEKLTEVGDNDDRAQQDTLCRNTYDSSKGKNRVSVNGALASALEALLMSAKGTSSSSSVVFHKSSLSVENTTESLSCSLSPGNVDDMSTKDGSVDQIPGSVGNANLDCAFISFQEIDGAPHTSLSKPVLESNAHENEKNNYLDSDKEAFGACTLCLGILSGHHIAEESINDENCINLPNNGPKLDTKPCIASTGPLDPPQPPAAFESIDNGAQMNENRPAIYLAEFLAARNSLSCKNGTSEVCCSTNGVEALSLERTLSEAGKTSKDYCELLVKKALEVDSEDECVSSVLVGSSSEASSYAAPDCVVNRHSIDPVETVSDNDCGLENTENSARLPILLNSVYSQFSATGSQTNLTENSSIDWTLDYSLSKPDVEDSWSDLINMESFSGDRASQPVVPASAAAGEFEEDLAGIGASSPVVPIAGEELQNVCDLLYDNKDNLLGMTSTEKRTSKSSPSLEVLLAESSDAEAQISDMEDMGNDAGIGFGSFSSDDSAPATTEPLLDVIDLPTESVPEPKPLETFADGIGWVPSDTLPVADAWATGLHVGHPMSECSASQDRLPGSDPNSLI